MPLIRKPSASPSTTTPDGAQALSALVSGSEDERWSAARAAASLPDGPKALGRALEQEKSTRVRLAIFTSLARIGTAESVELIIPFLRSDDANLRTAALDALRATRTTLGPHIQRLLKDGDADVRLLACELARNLPVEEASRMLCDLLETEPEANVCASAIEVLAEAGGPEALPALARCRQRFQGTAFLEFAIKITIERIRSQDSQQRA